MREVITHPTYCIQFLQPGRLVRIRYLEYDFGWGVVVNFQQKKPPKNQKEEVKPHALYVVDVLLQLSSNTSPGTQAGQDLPPGVRPPGKDEKGRMEVVPMLLSCIEQIGHMRIFLPKDLKSTEQRQAGGKSLEEVKRRFPDGIPVLDPIENMGISDDSFKKLLRVCQSLRMNRSYANMRIENRSTGISTSLQSFTQFSQASRSLQPIRKQDGDGNKDQGYQEADHISTGHYATR